MQRKSGYRQSENLSSSLLPGGSLIAAALHRQVMIWSDRGSASRHIGDRWAIRTASALDGSAGVEWPVPYGDSFRLLRVIRLDDVPEVSREANLHQAENPDFLLIGERQGHGGGTVVQAADAKFAADRIKSSQVSIEVVSRLIEVVEPVRELLDSTLGELGRDGPTVTRGVFICPDSELTDYLIRKSASQREAGSDAREIVRIPPEPDTMFVGLPMTRLIGPLARIDALPVTPRTNLISAIYYFRLACACFYLWSEGHRPLLTGLPVPDPEPGIVAAELSGRSPHAASAWNLVRHWADDIEPQVQAREAIANVASMPVRMRDVRAEVERAGRAEESGFVRYVRKELDLRFRRRLLELTGEIGADDPRPLPRILDDVAKAARALRPELAALLTELVREGKPRADASTPAGDR